MKPEQQELINQACEALQKLQELTDTETKQKRPQFKDHVLEEVFRIITQNGQREMTLERFKQAVNEFLL